MNRDGWIKAGAVLLVAVLLASGTYLALISADSNASYNVINSSTPAVMQQDYLALDILAGTPMEQSGSDIVGFESLGELNDMLEPYAEPVTPYYYDYRYGYDSPDALMGAAAEGGSGGGDDYSTTNIQVSGVDEGDILKNDGKYAYVVTADAGSVLVLDVYPPEDAAILSEIKVNGTVQEIYLDGDMLVVVHQCFYFEGGYYGTSYLQSDSPEIFVGLWSLNDRSAPEKVGEAVLPGYFSASRLNEHVLYLMGSQYVRGVYESEDALPLPLESLYRLEGMDSNNLMSFMTLDLENPGAAPGAMGIFMDPASIVYVSESNIYLTHLKDLDGTYSPLGEYVPPEEITVVHRLMINGMDIKYRARGEIPGRLLNRYSLDEHNGHLRAATTRGWFWGSDDPRNMVHVLDMNMSITGQLDDIAPGEQIYAARFMGDRCYLVTFRQVDPFFVIDLHDAESPQILGQLKIPGYSSYLHPYDNDHIIGIGMDGSQLKVSLFNVTDVENPTELDTYIPGGGYSTSQALYDPHAVMFNPQRNLLVLPAYIGQPYYYYYEEAQNGSGDGEMTGDVALVLDISPETGITERGRIQHRTELPQEMWDYYYYEDGPGYATHSILRSFYIEDVLYTLSGPMLKASSIDTLEDISTVELPYSGYAYHYRY